MDNYSTVKDLVNFLNENFSGDEFIAFDSSAGIFSPTPKNISLAVNIDNIDYLNDKSIGHTEFVILG